MGQLSDAMGRYRLQHQWREGADSWSDLYAPEAAGKVIIPSLKNTEGYWALLSAAHLETGKPYKEAQYDVDAGFKKLATLRTDAPLFKKVETLRWRGPTPGFAAWAERMGAPRLLERCAKAAAG